MREEPAVLDDVSNTQPHGPNSGRGNRLAVEGDFAASVRTSPMSSRRKVDFPQPLGPISTVVRPGGTVSVSGPRAGRPAYTFNTPFSANMTNRVMSATGFAMR